ncbi:MAG TPA: glutaredoxin family protein [Anaerolineales bacterium]|nr:glutaredoxin family protein [Anaerolineales bacterium]
MTNPLLNDEVAGQVKDVFSNQLKHPVEILFFGSKDNCEMCDETHKLLGEVTALSDKLHLTVYDLDENKSLASQYHVSMAPTIVVAGREGDQVTDYGVRFAGIPSGYEFSSLIQGLILVSGRDSGLAPATRQALKELKKPVLLQVFVTPT